MLRLVAFPEVKTWTYPHLSVFSNLLFCCRQIFSLTMDVSSNRCNLITMNFSLPPVSSQYGLPLAFWVLNSPLATLTTCLCNFFCCFTPLIILCSHTFAVFVRYSGFVLFLSLFFVLFLSSLMVCGLANLRLGWVCLGMELRVDKSFFSNCFITSPFRFILVCIVS